MHITVAFVSCLFDSRNLFRLSVSLSVLLACAGVCGVVVFVRVCFVACLCRCVVGVARFVGLSFVGVCAVICGSRFVGVNRSRLLRKPSSSQSWWLFDIVDKQKKGSSVKTCEKHVNKLATSPTCLKLVLAWTNRSGSRRHELFERLVQLDGPHRCF